MRNKLLIRWYKWNIKECKAYIRILEKDLIKHENKLNKLLNK